MDRIEATASIKQYFNTVDFLRFKMFQLVLMIPRLETVAVAWDQCLQGDPEIW